MQTALWERCIRPGDNEWTTWTDAIILAECAATALWEAGWSVVRSDSWRLRSGFDVVPHNDGSKASPESVDRSVPADSGGEHIDGTDNGS